MAKPTSTSKPNTLFGNASKSTILIALAAMLIMDLAIGLTLGFWLHAKPAPNSAATQPASQPETQPAATQPESPAKSPPEPVPASASTTSQADRKTLAHAQRSPIAQPGETFTAPLAPRKFASSTQHPAPGAPTQTAPVSPIPWHHAPQYLGQTVTIQGTVVDAHNTGKVCFLNFSTDKQHDFYIIIFDQAFAELPAPPEQLYLHKTVQVRGQVKTYRNRTQIQVRSKDQITIIP